MRHATDRDLLLYLDGEATEHIATEHIHEHIASCFACRERLHEVRQTLEDVAGVYRNQPLPPAAGPRAQLHISLRAPLVMALAACAALLISIVPGFVQRDHSRPKNTLTPGETRAITIGDVCMGEPNSRMIPASLQQKVFSEYGIDNARPNSYEVDYLITPELGGADSLRNLWPEPYSTVWNAHVKDALEDRLHDLVCQRKVDLATAQREIATDWIAAYKKYFHTNRPL
jgi:hypothetical protein